MTTGLAVLPGLGLDGRSWVPTLRAAAPRPVSVLTLPGYGRRAPRGTDLHPDALARWVVEDLGGTSSVLLAGHSSGCQVAAALARLLPDRVAGLVLVGPTTDPRAAGWFALASRWLATAVREDPRQVPSLVQQYSRTGLFSMLRAMGAARGDRIDRTLVEVRCPVLVVRGRHDRICPGDWAASLADRYVTLPVGGHMLPLTHGAHLARELDAFTALVEARGSSADDENPAPHRVPRGSSDPMPRKDDLGQ